MSWTHHSSPTTPFPSLPDELDDAVYDAYVTFVAVNLRGWPRSHSGSRSSDSHHSGSRSSHSSCPSVTPALSSGFSTPTHSLSRSSSIPTTPGPGPTVPFPIAHPGPQILPRSSSLPLLGTSLKERISAPIPLLATMPGPAMRDDDDPFSAAFERSMEATKIKNAQEAQDLAELLALPPPINVWRRGSAASVATLPCVKEEVEPRPVPFERAWW